MRNIAEVSPKIFLEFITDNINKLEWLFEVWDSFMWWKWNYTNLLWSLEILSWNSEYTVNVVELLFQLDEIYDSEVPNNHVNRPFWTLQEIFILWRNNTTLDIDNRIKLLKNNSKKYEQRVFNLLISLFNIEKLYEDTWDNVISTFVN